MCVMTLTFAMDVILLRNTLTGIKYVISINIYIKYAFLARKVIISNLVRSVILIPLPASLHLTLEHLIDVLEGNIANVGPVQQKAL